MAGMPVSTGGPPKSARAGIEAAMGEAQGELGQEDPAEAGQDPTQEMTEIESRIVRLEEALVSRGVLSEGDLTGPSGSDDQGNPLPPDPTQDPAAAAAGGAPPGAPPMPPGAPA